MQRFFDSTIGATLTCVTLFSLAIGLGIFACADMAQAQAPASQSRCGPHDALVKILHRNHGETRQALAVNHDGSLLEVFANTAEGNWTIVVTGTSGVSCIVALGSGYQRDGVAS